MGKKLSKPKAGNKLKDRVDRLEERIAALESELGRQGKVKVTTHRRES